MHTSITLSRQIKGKSRDTTDMYTGKVLVLYTLTFDPNIVYIEATDSYVLNLLSFS